MTKQLVGMKLKSSFSRLQLLAFILAFSLIGIILLTSHAAPNPNLPGDLDGNNKVDSADLAIMIVNYNTSYTGADINQDGTVDGADFSKLLSDYGQSITLAKPTAPTGLTATPGDSQVTLNWTANASSDQVDTYQVYWTTDPNWGTNNNNLNVTGTSYTVTGLTNGTTYYFRISAHNSAGYGPWGAAVSATPQAAGGGTSGVTPPAPPSAYTVPTPNVLVSNTSGLISALGGATRDIVLANGVYANASSVMIGNHRLWAQNLGGATLQFGLQIGGNGSNNGGEVHGLKLDIANASTTFDNAAISIWGGTAGQNAGVFDSWIYGHATLTFGIEDRITSGFKAQRLIMSDFTDFGVFFETYNGSYYTDSPAITPVVSDIDVSNVTRVPAGSNGGKSEAGIWAGTDCLCSNIKVRNAGWMGIWLGGNANNGTYSNFDIDNIGSDSVGVYLEHYSRSNIFKNFVIGKDSNGTGVKVGFNCEWADPAYAGTNPVAGQSIAGCHFNTFQDGTIYSSVRGVQLEDAEQSTIKNIVFKNQTNAAIDDFMTSGTGYTTVWQGLGNDFSGLAAGAVQYTTAH